MGNHLHACVSHNSWNSRFTHKSSFPQMSGAQCILNAVLQSHHWSHAFYGFTKQKHDSGSLAQNTGKIDPSIGYSSSIRNNDYFLCLLCHSAFAFDISFHLKQHCSSLYSSPRFLNFKRTNNCDLISLSIPCFLRSIPTDLSKLWRWNFNRRWRRRNKY